MIHTAAVISHRAALAAHVLRLPAAGEYLLTAALVTGAVLWGHRVAR